MTIKLIFPKDSKIKIPRKENFEDLNKIKKIEILEELPSEKGMATPREGPKFEARAPRSTADKLFGFK